MLLEIVLAYLSTQAERKAAATASASVFIVFGGGGLLVLMRSRTLLRQGRTWQGGGPLVCGLFLLWIT
jgi:hypothetical protein